MVSRVEGFADAGLRVKPEVKLKNHHGPGIPNYCFVGCPQCTSILTS